MNEIAKQTAARAAADLIQDGMTIGLGSGSTSAFFIQFLIQRVKKGLKIQAAASSKASYDQAAAGGIPLLDTDLLTHLDVTVDGADEIDRNKQMIKGGGGALLREKILAAMSKEMIVIVDESKSVEKLGKHPVPVEIVPFACQATIRHLNEQGYQGKLRTTKEGAIYRTDNENYIYDISLIKLCDDPSFDDIQIRAVPGVVETGFFINLAKRVIIGFNNECVKIHT